MTVNFNADVYLTKYNYTVQNENRAIEDDHSVAKVDSITGDKKNNYKIVQKFDVPQYFSGTYYLVVNYFGSTIPDQTATVVGCVEYSFNIVNPGLEYTEQ